MSELRLHLPRLTLDWLNQQPDGCATAVRRILRESFRRSGAAEVPAGHWRPSFGERDASNPDTLELMSVYVMRAHIEEMLARLAAHLGRDEAQALATRRCPADLSRPILDCWKAVVADLHALCEEQGALPPSARWAAS